MVYQKALALDADIYHFHDPELLPYGLKLKKRGKKVIFDSHEFVPGSIYEKVYIPKAIRKVIKAGYEAYQNHVCKQLNAVITVTPSVTEYFQYKGCRVTEICNYPILQAFGGLPDYSSRTIVFAGGISPQWNHDHIIDSLSQIDDVKYLLCGGTSESYLSFLQEKPCWEKVDYLGKLPFEQVSNVLQGAAAGMSLLTPGANTDWENGTMGNTKIFEEMMASLPIICTNFVRWKEFVEKYDCGICVDPGDSNKIADAIKYLIDQPEEAKRMGENARRAVKEEFNWEIELDKLLQLYREL